MPVTALGLVSAGIKLVTDVYQILHQYDARVLSGPHSNGERIWELELGQKYSLDRLSTGNAPGNSNLGQSTVWTAY